MDRLRKTYLHHTSLAKGYIKVGTSRIEKYDGKFGKGYKIFLNNPKSSRFCLVEYHIFKEERKNE